VTLYAQPRGPALGSMPSRCSVEKKQFSLELRA